MGFTAAAAIGGAIGLTGVAAVAVGGAVIGAAVGGITAAVTGGNILKGVLVGAVVGGAIGAVGGALGLGGAGAASGSSTVAPYVSGGGQLLGSGAAAEGGGILGAAVTPAVTSGLEAVAEQGLTGVLAKAGIDAVSGYAKGTAAEEAAAAAAERDKANKVVNYSDANPVAPMITKSDIPTMTDADTQTMSYRIFQKPLDIAAPTTLKPAGLLA